jgi:simple sugar transport system ATP-binding protein
MSMMSASRDAGDTALGTSVSVAANGARSSDEPALELRHVCKRYGTVEALIDAQFTLRRGEVHALLGDNGAGKSTLLKIAAGVIAPDVGEILVDGAPVAMSSPNEARQIGIETVYQDLALADDRSAVANVFMARELLRTGLLRHLGILDRKKMAAKVREEFDRLAVPIADARRPVREFSGGQRQGIALARAAMWARTIVLLDEPTAALGVRQRAMVHELMNALREQGLGVLLVSHDVPEVLRIADTVSVLRLGRCVATVRASEVDTRWCVGAIVGDFDNE